MEEEFLKKIHVVRRSKMEIEDVRLGMELVTSGGRRGWVVTIEKEGGLVLETADKTRFQAHVECVKPAREHVIYVDESSNVDICDDWIEYWHTFDFNYQPIAAAAKCYKQVEPEALLLSDDAKIVCELLRSSGPMTSYEISDRLQLLERCVIESLIEAREAGIVRLDDGKYSILRD